MMISSPAAARSTSLESEVLASQRFTVAPAIDTSLVN
jgi:hypothetical protein